MEAVMNNKILIGAITLVLGKVSTIAQADGGRRDGRDDDYRGRGRGQDYARVVGVEPLYERVRYSVPVEQCWTEERNRGGYRADRTGAAIVGGAVGAILGNNIGRGDGRRAATLGGAVIGAAVGSELARQGDGYAREPRREAVEHCRTRYEDRYDERVAAYRVTYVYNGRREVTRLPYDPGRYLRVAVDVRPIG
jgi:uncharacterized protein YcfJ